MSKWNLTREFAGGEVVDTVEGPYKAAAKRARELEKKNNWDIIIYQSF